MILYSWFSASRIPTATAPLVELILTPQVTWGGHRSPLYQVVQVSVFSLQWSIVILYLGGGSQWGGLKCCVMDPRYFYNKKITQLKFVLVWFFCGFWEATKNIHIAFYCISVHYCSLLTTCMIFRSLYSIN